MQALGEKTICRSSPFEFDFPAFNFDSIIALFHLRNDDQSQSQSDASKSKSELPFFHLKIDESHCDTAHCQNSVWHGNVRAFARVLDQFSRYDFNFFLYLISNAIQTCNVDDCLPDTHSTIVDTLFLAIETSDTEIDMKI